MTGTAPTVHRFQPPRQAAAGSRGARATRSPASDVAILVHLTEREGVDLTFDGAYLQRLCDGDPETERHFVAYFGRLLRIKLRARRVAEDAIQETFLRVFRALRSGDGLRRPERLGAFVNAVCDNVVHELYRASIRHPQSAEDAAELMVDRTADVERQLLDAEQRRAVHTVIDTLAPRDRLVLRALFVEDQDKDAVCAELGVGREYLRVLLHRAKNQFRDLYVARQRQTTRNESDPRSV